MPRQPRPDLADVPQHVVQRGNDRQPCFYATEDYRRYLAGLRESAIRYGCSVHAYVLMTNHVHLLVTPSSAGAVSRMMQWLGRQYVGYINGRYRRTGTLWEGRYKSCLVDTERYLLTCYRYIELNPVRAAMVADPADYAWSSYRTNAQALPDKVVVPHAEYLRLGADAAGGLYCLPAPVQGSIGRCPLGRDSCVRATATGAGHDSISARDRSDDRPLRQRPCPPPSATGQGCFRNRL
jgi:putative transposase